VTYQKKIHTSVRFPHPTGIVISKNADLGEDVLIQQNVTIGNKSRAVSNCYPTINDNVVIHSGAVIVGDITIGENSTIGANSVVINDIPANSIAVEAPAQVVSTTEE
jgi:serine O-acetyltransferase